MSEIAAELVRVQSAFDQPTLTLLHQRQAPVVITIFRQAFGRDNRPVPTARLHTLVEGYLDELRQGMHDDLEGIPTGTGRELCQRWMRGQWLVRSLDETDQEVYTLTWHAQQAVELVKSLSRDRATLSQHRISTIVDTVRRFNADANPDPGVRVEILDQEIARLSGERDRLLGGGELPSPTDDYLDEGFTELLSLVAALPSDFARVEERFAQIRGEILAAFRAEDRPAGEVIDGYLARADELMTTTPEGRAFEGAFALLRDDELVSQLRADLSALLEHPGAGRLSEADRAELRGTVRLVREGLDRVLSQRSRVTAALKEYIVSHDGARDRELEQTLRQIESELTTWIATTGPRATLDVPLLPARAGVEHLRERFHDPADDLPPERLRSEPPEQSRPELGSLLAQGGPSMPELTVRLREALGRAATSGTRPSLGRVFDTLEESRRRPVEIFGLLQLAAQRELVPLDGEEEYHTVRPDGTGRSFAVPRLEVGPDGPDRRPRTSETDTTPEETSA